MVTSLAEQAGLIEGGQLKPLAMLTAQSADIAGLTVPSAFDSYPPLAEVLPLKQAIGFAIHNSAPEHVKATLGSAFEKAMASETVAEWAKANNYDVGGQYGPEAQALFSTLESTFAYTLKDLGATKVMPEELGIQQP